MTFTSYNQFMCDLQAGGADYAAEKAKSLGFSGVEFLDLCGTGTPIDKEKYNAKEVREALEGRGLTVDCYSVYANALFEDKEYFMSEIKREIDYAAAVGSKLFHHTVVPAFILSDDIPKYDDIFDTVVETESRVAEYCAEKGLKLIFEPQGFCFNGVEGLSKLIITLREKYDNVGFCADLGNPVYVDNDPGEVIDKLSFCLEHIHVKDYIVSDTSLGREGEARSVGGKYLYEVLPADGMLDLAGYLKKLKATGYDGRISLEYGADDETMVKSMQYIKGLWEE